MYQKYNILDEHRNIGADIFKKIAQKHGKGGHPRLIMTKERIAFLKEHIGKDDVYGITIANVIKDADRKLEMPLRKYELRDTLRLLYVSTEIMDIVMACGEAFLLTDEKKYLDRALSEIRNAFEFPDWHPYHDLDYGVLGYPAAFAYDWFYDYIDDEEKAYWRKKIYQFELTPAMDDYLNRSNPKGWRPGWTPDTLLDRTYPWAQDTPGDNHKFICNGGINLCAMAICDDVDDEMKKVCEDCLSYGYDIDYRFIRMSFDERDGSYYEGVSYWEYGLRHFCLHMKGMLTACGTAYDMINFEGFKKTPYYPISLAANNMISFCFSDGREGNVSFDLLLFLGDYLGIPGVVKVRQNRIVTEKCGQHYDLAWLEPEAKENGASMPTEYGAIGTSNATFRTDWNNGSMFVGIHYGKNRLPHGHLDMGEFVVDYGSKRFFGDYGQDNYNIPRYNDCYRVRAEGHNCLVINPSTEPDQSWEGESYIEKLECGDISTVSSDISSGYPNKKVVRELSLDKKTSIATLTDTIECDKNDEVYWFGQIRTAKADISADGKTAILDIDGVKLAVKSEAEGTFFLMPAGPAEWSPESPDQAVNKDCNRLVLKTSGSTKHTIKVTFAPAK